MKKGILILLATVAVVAGAVQLTSAAENELTITHTVLTCSEAAVQVNYHDIEEQGGPTDKRLIVHIDSDGDGSFNPVAVFDEEINDGIANESEPSIYTTNLLAGAQIRARLFNVEADPDLLVDEDIFVASACPTPTPVPTTGSIFVNVLPEGDPGSIDFEFNPGADFSLDEDEPPILRTGLAPGVYVIDAETPAGYVAQIHCEPADVVVNNAAGRVSVNLHAGEAVTCLFFFHLLATATPAPTATATPAPVATATPEPSVAQPLPTAPVSSIEQTVNIVVAPAATAAPAPVTLPVLGSITPPRTGDGGLLK